MEAEAPDGGVHSPLAQMLVKPPGPEQDRYWYGYGYRQASLIRESVGEQ